MYGKAVPPPVELIVTEPKPPLVTVILVPATICVTPPFSAYEALIAFEILPLKYEAETALSACEAVRA